MSVYSCFQLDNSSSTVSVSCLVGLRRVDAAGTQMAHTLQEDTQHIILLCQLKGDLCAETLGCTVTSRAVWSASPYQVVNEQAVNSLLS